MGKTSNTNRAMLNEAYLLMIALKSILKAGNNITPEMLPILQSSLEKIDRAMEHLNNDMLCISSYANALKAQSEWHIEDNPDEDEVKDWQLVRNRARDIFEISDEF